jgi:hypothetical protein
VESTRRDRLQGFERGLGLANAVLPVPGYRPDPPLHDVVSGKVARKRILLGDGYARPQMGVGVGYSVQDDAELCTKHVSMRDAGFMIEPLTELERLHALGFGKLEVAHHQETERAHAK